MSSPAQFKFTKDGITRRVAFTQLPSWLELAAKLESLYSIPVEHVAVSYADADGDEVTLSSQEELEDYYRADLDPLLRRLSVVDLSVIRSFDDKPLPDTPSITHRLRDTPSNNTFGTVPFHQDIVDDDWQRVPGFNPFYSAEISSGSGNELRFAQIGGDSSLRSSVARDTAATYSRVATPTPASENKGKAREPESTSSTDSVLANDTPEKPPVHVYEVSGRSIPSTGTTINIQEVPPSNASSTHDAPDPPLAELDPPSLPTPTLTGDVATFLGMISTVFVQNPQLTTTLRGIMQNIGSGTYWTAHRDQLSRAAEEICRSAPDIQAHINASAAGSAYAETYAARQIAEAIGDIVRSFTQNVSPQEGDNGEHLPRGWPNHPPPPPHSPFSPGPPPHRGHFPPPPPPHRGPFPPGPPPHHGPFPPFPPAPPLHDGFPFHGRGPFGPGRGGRRGGPFHWGPHGRHWHHGPGGHHGPEGHGRHRRHGRRSDQEDSHSDSSGESADDAEADVSMYGVSQKVSPEERKAKLLAAKAEYKAQKAMYRAEKQAKQTERQRSNTADTCVELTCLDEPPADLSPFSDVAEAAARVASNNDVNSPARPDAQINAHLISHGRGQFPSLEMVSVPRRHHTISGGTIRGSRHGRNASGSTNQTATVEVRRARVVRKLSDVRRFTPYPFHLGNLVSPFQMGFGDTDIANRVSVHIPDDQSLEENSEDAIVANVVEELLQTEGNGTNETPSTPRAN